jgi:hypothetical protein
MYSFASSPITYPQAAKEKNCNNIQGLASFSELWPFFFFLALLHPEQSYGAEILVSKPRTRKVKFIIGTQSDPPPPPSYSHLLAFLSPFKDDLSTPLYLFMLTF